MGNLYVQWVAMVSLVYIAEEKVASTLNRLVDRVFFDVPSPRDKSSMADLIVDFSRRIRKRTQTERREAW